MTTAILDAMRDIRPPAEAPPSSERPRSRRKDAERPIRPSMAQRIETTLGRWLLRIALASAVAALPFYLLVRGALVASAAWGWHAWLAVGFGASLAALVVAGVGWWALRRLGFARSFRGIVTRAAFPLVAVFCASCLLHLAGTNAKTDEIRAGYPSLHPALRLAVGTLRLVDDEIVLTDIERGPESYAQMRLPRPEHSAHYPQSDGTVHAIDLRTAGVGPLRNGLVQLYFELLGFETLRHVGTADHLHVRLPEFHG
jgi:hypothetical protein